MTYHISESSKPLIGTQKWAEEYKMMYPNEDDLRKECEEYMEEFDDRERLKLQREKLMADTPDEVRGRSHITFCLFLDPHPLP